MVFYLKNYDFLVTCRYCYASKSPKYVKMLVQTGTYVQRAFEERKGSGQRTHMAQDLFCGFCHLRELDYTDKQIENCSSALARP